MTTQLEHVPPSSQSAETATLGACLLEVEAIRRAEELLLSADFYQPRHGLIFGAILDLYKQKKPVDLVTLGEHLRDTGKLADIGGTPYLTALMESAPTAAGIAHYAGIVLEKSRARQLIVEANRVMQAVYGGGDTDDLLRQHGEFIHQLQAAREKRVTMRTIGEYSYSAYSELESAVRDKRAIGFRTGWRSVNEMLRPFRPGQLIVLAADTGVGKTVWALNLAVDLAEQGLRGIFYSLEMEGEELTTRAILEKMVWTQDDLDSIETHEEADNVLAGVYNAVERLYALPLHVDEEPANSVSRMERMIQQISREHGKVSFVVVDYLQLTPGEHRGAKRYEEVGEISRALKELAKHYKLTVFATCQVGTKQLAEQKTRRPTLASVYESARIGQDSDLVLALYHPGFYGAEEMKRAGYDPIQDKEIVELLVLKSRRGTVSGHKPSTKLRFKAAHVSFQDLTSDDWKRIYRKGESE